MILKTESKWNDDADKNTNWLQQVRSKNISKKKVMMKQRILQKINKKAGGEK